MAMDVAADLERGRDAAARSAWAEAHAALSRAAHVEALGAGDLELLATVAAMLGRDDERVAWLERAYHAHTDPPAAARCAFWLGLTLLLRGEPARAGGWFGRAQRLVTRHDRDCVERGYLLLPVVIERQAAGEHAEAEAAAADAAAIAERFGDADLLALALHEQGHALAVLGRVDDGLRLLDEAMVAVCAGEVSPFVTGLVYCGVIDYCHALYELPRAQEWTAALDALVRASSRSCSRSPAAASSTAPRSCSSTAHGTPRSEEARRAGARPGRPPQAAYREAEVRRLQGELAAAEAAYRAAAEAGAEPQPGLALLRLAQGGREAANAALRRALGETAEPLQRARLLPAAVEVRLAAGDPDGAAAACAELERIAATLRRELLDALVAHARGAVALARGDAAAALADLRDAGRRWRTLAVPYEAARSRELRRRRVPGAGRRGRRRAGARAPRGTPFAALGAVPDRDRLDAARPPARPDRSRAARCCGTSRPERRTARSPPSSC